ncbi:MAG: hypothetical protein PHS41_01705 [Victivallaceae bacterium]|nr:hypothetical protein [Victivallaceae bacterium]
MNVTTPCGEARFQMQPSISRVFFWKTNKCFSIEPFWDVKLAPGETGKWQCKVSFSLPAGTPAREDRK